MKYTNRVIEGDINIDGMVSSKPVLKQLTIVLGLVVAFFGLIILTSMLPIAAGIDSARYIKLRYHYYTKKQKKKDYVEDILSSLAVPEKERKKMTKLITEV